MLYAVLAVSSIARGRVAVARRRRRQGASRRRRGDDAGEPAAARAGPGREDRPVHASASRRCRTTACATPTSRSRSSIAETLEAATEGARAARAALRGRARRASASTAASASCRTAVGIGAPAGVRERRRRRRPRRRGASGSRPTYETPSQYHNAMEPHAIVAAWDGDRLTIDTPNQALAMAQARVRRPSSASRRRTSTSAARSSAAASARRRSSPGRRSSRILAARMLGRPVKLVLRRDQMYGPVGHRGADPPAAAPRHGRRGPADGARASRRRRRPAASTTSSSRPPTPRTTLYASPAIATTHDGVRVDTGTPGPMRAPGEATGLGGARMRDRRGGLGLRHRSARVPPAQLRRGRSGHRQAVLLEGAARMLRRRAPSASAGPGGRSRRGRCATTPASSSAGAWAPRLFPAPMFQAEARAVLRADGTALVETSARRHGPGRLDRARPDRRRRARPRRRAGRVPRRPLRPSRRRHRRRLGPHRDRGQRHLRRRQRRRRQARRARHRRPERSPLFGAGNAGVDGARRPAAPPRRREPQRELRRHPRPRRPGRDRGHAAAAPATRPTPGGTRCTRTARSSPR